MARHFRIHQAEPRSGAIFMRFVFCHGRPFGISARRTSIRCNIQEKMADSWLKRIVLYCDEHQVMKMRQVRRQGGARGARAPPPPPPKSQKGPPDGIVKYLKWYKNNPVMVGLTILMHFQQFEDLKFLIFSGGVCPGTPQKLLQSVQASRIRRDRLDFTWESRIPTQLQSGHEYLDFE